MEGAAVLGDCIELTAKRAERATVYGVGVCCSCDIWSGSVNGRVNHKGCGVQEADWAAINDFAFVVDLDEV